MALIFVAGLTGGASAMSDRPPMETVEKIDGDINAILHRFGVPGATVMVLVNGKTSFVAAFGSRDVQRRLPVRPDSFFEIGSITKQFTAASILQLQEAGKLKIDDPVSNYLPDAPHAREITLRQLLSHTSGLHDYFDAPQIDQLASRPISYADLIARIASLPLDFPPGSQWHYSNTGYQMLGKIIEKVSGETYKAYLQHHILDPLHMTDTYTTAEEARLPNMAIGYRHVSDRLERAPMIHADWGGAAGFLISTQNDLAKWDAALRGGKVVSLADYRQMATAVMTTKNGSADYGLGLFVDSRYGQPRIGHTGGSNGFTTADEYFPKQDVRIIAFTNLGDATPEAGETLTNIIFADLYPAIAATAQQPAAGENAAITQTVRAAFGELQVGKSYTRFSAHLKGKLTGGSGASFVTGLGPYGPSTAAIFKGVHRDAGDVWYDYALQFGPGVLIPFAVRIDADGAVSGLSVG
ncbi:MAG TPA: serine hydrolase domain-containing protein [Rhizomicrobium sp.]